jgi:hypothetical protein
MAARTRPPNEAALITEARRADDRPGDQAFNEQMTLLLRQAAEARDDRQEARSAEDDQAGRRATAALYALVDGEPGSRKR